MFDQQVGASDFAGDGEIGSRDALGAVMACHELLQLVWVGACRGLPSRVFGLGMEVVREVLRVRAAHLPALGQAGFDMLLVLQEV